MSADFERCVHGVDVTDGPDHCAQCSRCSRELAAGKADLRQAVADQMRVPSSEDPGWYYDADERSPDAEH